MKVILKGVNVDEKMQSELNDLDNKNITIINPGSRKGSLELTEKDLQKKLELLFVKDMELNVKFLSHHEFIRGYFQITSIFY